MRPGNQHTEVRHGFVQTGDLIYVPMLGVFTEVMDDSIYLGSKVSTHNKVFRLATAVNVFPVFDSPSERADYLREFDGVRLRRTNRRADCSGAYASVPRVVVGKDAQFVYLREPGITAPNSVQSTTTNKVCRSTGKVWVWTNLGWEPSEWEMFSDDEREEVGATLKINHPEAVDPSFYGD